MKICSFCGQLLPESSFYKDKTHNDGLSSMCKPCRLQRDKERYASAKDKILERNRGWYQRNREKRSEDNKKYREDHQVELRQMRLEKYHSSNAYAQSLKKPCAKCGESRPYLIQFHHIDPASKSFQVCGLSKHTTEEIDAEVQKCVCLCANCHKEYHYFYGIHPADPTGSIIKYLLKE